MRQLEKSQSQLFTSTKDTRKDIPFVRAAKAGGWRTALSEESAARIEEAPTRIAPARNCAAERSDLPRKRER